MIPLAVVLGLFWGVLWALFLQMTPLGAFLAERRTWVVVVIGVGVDLLITLLVLNVETWLAVCGIVAASGVGIVMRSWWNEWRENVRSMEAWRGGDEDQSPKQGGVGSR